MQIYLNALPICRERDGRSWWVRWKKKREKRENMAAFTQSMGTWNYANPHLAMLSICKDAVNMAAFLHSFWYFVWCRNISLERTVHVAATPPRSRENLLATTKLKLYLRLQESQMVPYVYFPTANKRKYLFRLDIWDLENDISWKKDSNSNRTYLPPSVVGM